uniref:C2H2-type domain-containing protein n=1 Tax=Cajanus cajan TaxID=3821 RepID=A0A151SEY8_CAJCA|nr:hypothetical protein KK1_024781 [Cajanus cajan]
MAGKLELGPPKFDVSNPKQQAARKILKIVRSQGHPYVELRENGKKFIYFCTLCLAPCYSDDVLFNHLKGNLHKERLSAAKVTLLGPKPWPFNDGLVFFDTSTESDKELGVADSYQNRLLKVDDNEGNLAIVKFDEGVQSNAKPYQFNNHILCTRFISSKALRKELRRKQRLAAEKVCNICQQKMLPGKDVAALMNLKTRRVACSSRNRTGAFHVFHTSCLIHWIILCEFEIITNHLVRPNVRRVKRKVASDGDKIGKEKKIEKHIRTVFCPECQGTGMIIDGDGVEHPEFSLSQMFKFKIKACDARREWIKSPEILQNCSTGFHFPSQSEEIFEEKVQPINLLHFYRADDHSVV